MKGTWEDIPASPCSGASCDTTMRSSLTNSPQARPFVALPHATAISVDIPDDQPALRTAKRARVDPALQRQSSTIEFVEAPLARAEPTTELVSKLNLSAEDARRKALLERLRAIDSKRALLRASPTHDDDDVILIAEKPSPKPKQTRASTRQSGRRRGATKRTAAGTTKGPAKQIAQQVIDVDDEHAVIAPVRAKGKAKKATTPKSKAKPTSHAVPQRVSSRVRRRRTPNLLDEDAANRPSPVPNCMNKCRRMQFCKRLINTMLRDPTTAPFSAPVNELWPEQAIPRYFDVIRCPMDLRTVKKNLETTKFLHPTPGDFMSHRFDVGMFMDDVRLVFTNARLYNKAGDMLHTTATALLADFESTMDKLPPPPSPEEIAAMLAKKRSYGARKKDREVTASRKKETDVVPRSETAKTTTKSPRHKKSSTARHSYDANELEMMSGTELRDRLLYLRKCRVPVIARTPVPKGSGYLSRAALLYDVEMTWEEKRRLKDNVEKVPESKLEAFISMIKKSSNDSAKEESNECFELDMDNLNNIGLRNIEAFLEEFVPGFKTCRSSSLGREFTSVDSLDEEMVAIRKRISDIPRVERNVRDSSKIANQPKSFYADNDSSSESSSDDESGSDADSSDESDSE